MADVEQIEATVGKLSDYYLNLEPKVKVRRAT